MDYRYNTAKEFNKSIKHNNKIYQLHALYDDDKYDFDKQIRIFNKHKYTGYIDFDNEIQSIQLYDRLNDLYNTDLFD